MNNKQTGFTLIELIAVIAILGILAAVAVPRFVDLQDSARDAAVRGIAGALASAHALNHAANIATDANLANAPAPIVITDCGDSDDLLDGGLDAGSYTLTAGAIGAAEGDTTQCTVTDANDNNFFATFTAYNVQ